MSITPVGSIGSAQAFAPASSVKPESAEIPGAPDHDGDSDDAAKAQSVATTRSTLGSLNVKA
jgi:hypothetical protein